MRARSGIAYYSTTTIEIARDGSNVRAVAYVVVARSDLNISNLRPVSIADNDVVELEGAESTRKASNNARLFVYRFLTRYAVG